MSGARRDSLCKSSEPKREHDNERNSTSISTGGSSLQGAVSQKRSIRSLAFILKSMGKTWRVASGQITKRCLCFGNPVEVSRQAEVDRSSEKSLISCLGSVIGHLFRRAKLTSNLQKLEISCGKPGSI